jgi:hypothetical protein
MKPAAHPQSKISAESVAYKIAAMRNFYTPQFHEQVTAQPRLLELLWFIQWQSIQPGGLERFALEFLEAFAGRIGTAAMHSIGKIGQPYTAAERHSVIADFPYDLQIDTPLHKRTRFHGMFLDGLPARSRSDLAFISKLNYAHFFDACRDLALRDIPRLLNWFCTLPDTPERLMQRHYFGEVKERIDGEDRRLEGVWYFKDLPGALIEMMDIHAAQQAKVLAQTTVAVKTFDALQYALAQSAMVRVEGQTRFGKTHASKTFAAMKPGQVRLVRTPSSPGEFELLSAIAESFGLLVTPKTERRELKLQVEFIIRHSGLMLIFDEAHFLLPSSVSRFTSPKRLDWIRTQIVDRGCAIALITTPQEFRHSVNKLTKATGHNIDQFLGRTLLPIRLPDRLNASDLRLVAVLHFPGIDPDYLEVITGKALRSEGFLMTIEAIAKRAAYIAQREGHDKMNLEDLRRAADEIMPAIAPPVASPARATAPALRLERSAPAATATPNHKPAPLTSPARAITPEMEKV